MDKRSWPWKKKSSDKEKSAATASASELDTAIGEKAKDEASKKTRYVQMSVESYSHLTGLENVVKSYEEQIQSLEDEVNELIQKLSKANSEIANKETLVKQHAKVAEEAVSGWEKVEAEAAALKNHLESVTLLKLTAEDHKECMRQQNLTNQKLFDKMKLDLESRIAILDRDLIRSAAENTTISRSLQEHSNMLVQLSEEKSRLNSHIESLEKEAGSLKYELHIARKEAEIRNEEKNMTQRSAEVANRQHLEGAKKIAKLEAECQRLRGLVRKKLPGPAALSQMKLEVEKYGEPRLRRACSPDFMLDGSKIYQKENERLLAMEEETKMLKEALATRNSELQACRSLFAQTATRLRKLEVEIQTSGGEREIRGKRGKLSSFASMSEDGNDDNVSCFGSSEVSHLWKEKNVDNQLGLMDDFLEMEKLAHSELSDELLGNIGKSRPKLLNYEDRVEVRVSRNSKESPQLQAELLVFAELQLKISTVLKSISSEEDGEKVAAKIRHIMQDINESWQLLTVSSGKNNDMKEDVKYVGQELQTAIIQIYDFVSILGKEAMPTYRRLTGKVETFTAKYSEAIYSQLNPIDFILDISLVLKEARELQHFDILGFRDSEVKTGSSDCIDKIALPENKQYSSNSGSDPDVPNDGNLVPISESWKCSFEQLKTDKDSLEYECIENSENTKCRLERDLGEVKLQLRLAEKSNSLAETQLKCMAESYKSLEELKNDAISLRAQIKTLESELREERRCHQHLQKQLERIDFLGGAAEDDDKISQEKEVAAAAEKLAECQETIFLLGKQLKALRSPSETPTLPNNLVSNSVKAKQSQNLLLSEKQVLAKQLQQFNESLESLKSEEQMKYFHIEALSSVQEGGHMTMKLEAAKWELADAEKELKMLKSSVLSSGKELEQIQRKVDDVQIELEYERQERRKLDEEVVELNRTLEELTGEAIKSTIRSPIYDNHRQQIKNNKKKKEIFFSNMKLCNISNIHQIS